jgi:HK97 family phage prohead protease
MSEEDRETFRREVSVRIAEGGDGRTLIARLVPYNTVATVNDGAGAYKERFAPGAFNAQINAAHRIKAFLNFRHRQGISDQIGHATKIEDRNDGLHGELRVLENSDGDKALQLVDAGVLDKLSIEFESLKHRMVDGVLERVSARLKGVALVPDGAYTGAEVIAVREQIESEEKLDLPAPFDPDLAAGLARLGIKVPDALTVADTENDEPESTEDEAGVSE